MADTQYHNSEMVNLNTRLHRISLASLADRKAAQAEALELMRDLERVSRNLDWLLAGNYGYAEQYRIKQIAGIDRGNRAAQSMQLLAALDCGCPQTECIRAWKALTTAEQGALDACILTVLDSSDTKGE